MNVSEIETAKAFFENKYYIKNGIVFWKSNNRVPFSDMLMKMHCAGVEFDIELSNAEREKQIERKLQEYKSQKKSYSNEEMFEMQNVFGKGNTVVDVLTGQTIRL